MFCSGKVYYELEAAREEKGMHEAIAIARVEQLAPFPFDLVMRELKRYPQAQVRALQSPAQRFLVRESSDLPRRVSDARTVHFASMYAAR